MAARSRRFLRIALPLSLLIHLCAGAFVRIPQAPPDTTEPAVLKIDREPRPTPPPTPRPTPRPTPPPPRPPAAARVTIARPHRAPVHAPHVTAHRDAPARNPGLPRSGALAVSDGPPNADGVAPAASAEPTAAPTTQPTATPTPPSCAHPNVAAATIVQAAVDTPAIAQQSGIVGVVDVIVKLDERSRIVDARISNSPSPVLNAAALRAVHESTFRTEVRNCIPVAAEYRYSVEFTSQ